MSTLLYNDYSRRVCNVVGIVSFVECINRELSSRVSLLLVFLFLIGAARHGLQSLGKIGSSRRIPPPANLPSLKSENSGNDPTVSLVPSGGGGWGSTKDKPESTTQSSTPPPPPQTNAAVNQQPILQPQRPTGPLSFPSSQPPVQQQQQQNSAPTRQETATTKQEKNEAHAKTWGSVSQNEAGGQGGLSFI